jgi:hypothetical protein
MRINVPAIEPKVDSFLTARKIKPEDYIPGTITFDWINGIEGVTEGGVYERRLIDHLKNNRRNDYEGEVKIIIGGIGTGKSTTIDYVIEKIKDEQISCDRSNEENDQCTLRPDLLRFRFPLMQEKEDMEKEKIVTEDDFWRYTTKFVRSIGEIELEDEIELIHFWKWCLDHPDVLIHLTKLLKTISKNEDRINEYRKLKDERKKEELLETLKKERQELKNSFTLSEFTWYNVYKLLFNIKARKETVTCPCKVFFLDNVDQLSPQLQKLAVNFLIQISELLKVKSLITIRPLTWESNKCAIYLIDTIPHSAPAIESVILKRITKCHAHYNDDETNKFLTFAKTFLHGNDNIYRNMFKATSGHSSRFAIRNFANMLRSPLLKDVHIENESFKNMKVSTMARAYFFGNKERINSDAFENLYSVNGDNRIEYSLIKPRILDFIIRLKKCNTRLNDIVDFLQLFGYENNIILNAMNDLLNKYRPLVWSDCAMHLNNLLHDSLIAMTPIGLGYYNVLFGEVYYDQVCITMKRDDDKYIQDVYDHHRALFERDLEELQTFCKNSSIANYRNHYPDEKISISVMHCDNLILSLKMRDPHNESKYDPKRREFITHEVKQKVNRLIGNI